MVRIIERKASLCKHAKSFVFHCAKKEQRSSGTTEETSKTNEKSLLDSDQGKFCEHSAEAVDHLFFTLPGITNSLAIT